MRFVTHPPSVSPPHPIRIKRSKSFVGVVAHVTHRQTAAAFVSRLSRRRFILRLLLFWGHGLGGCKTPKNGAQKKETENKKRVRRGPSSVPCKIEKYPLFLKKAEPQKQTHFPFTALLLFSGSGLMPQKVWFALQDSRSCSKRAVSGCCCCCLLLLLLPPPLPAAPPCAQPAPRAARSRGCIPPRPAEA